jgi:hypothetical protein
VRLIFENSTVCHLVDELVLYALIIFLVLGLFFTVDNDSGFMLVLFSAGYQVFDGEFDPGSGRTLAACLTHASRAERPFWGYSSGERVSNT